MEEVTKSVKSWLTADDVQNHLREYFVSVFEAENSGDEFPIDLDLVWPIVYAKKSNCVRELRNKFLEGVDYQVLLKNEQNPTGGRPEESYRISVGCMEWLIARNVREVFEVYRTVFHGVARKVQRGEVIHLPNDTDPSDRLFMRVRTKNPALVAKLVELLQPLERRVSLNVRLFEDGER